MKDLIARVLDALRVLRLAAGRRRRIPAPTWPAYPYFHGLEVTA